MDVSNVVTLICDEMAKELTKEQLQKLESILYKNFRHLQVIETCTEIEAAPFGSDVGMVRLFIATKRLAGRSEKTLEQYNLEIWISRTCIGKSFADTTTMDVKVYLSQMHEKGLSPTTLNNKRRYLNSFYKFLHEEGFIKENPISRIDAITEPIRRKKSYRISDLERLRNRCETKRDRAVFEFLLATGLRISELTALKVGDLDTDRRRFEVIGKGNKQRVAFYDEMADYYLQIYLEWRKGHEGITEEELQEKPLFAGIKKPYKGIDNNGVRALLRRLAKKAGVENVHPHRFRRTFASTALHRQMPIEKVQRVLGHTKVETTLMYIDQERDLEQAYRTYIA